MRDQSLMFKAWNNEHAQNIAPRLSCKKILRSKWDNSYLKKECQPTIIGVFTASGDFLPMLTYFILLICLESQYSFIRNVLRNVHLYNHVFSSFPCDLFFIMHWKLCLNFIIFNVLDKCLLKNNKYWIKPSLCSCIAYLGLRSM